MSRDEGQRAVRARPISKTLFEIFIGAHAYSVAKEPNQTPAEDYQDTDSHKSRNQLIPITRKRGTGIGNESDAADNRGEHGKAQSPMRHGTTRGKIGFCGILPARAPKADTRHHDEVHRDDDQVRCAHSVQVTVLSPWPADHRQTRQKKSMCHLRPIGEQVRQQPTRRSSASSHAPGAGYSRWIQASSSRWTSIESKHCGCGLNHATSSKAFCRRMTRNSPSRSSGRPRN